MTEILDQIREIRKITKILDESEEARLMLGLVEYISAFEAMRESGGDKDEIKFTFDSFLSATLFFLFLLHVESDDEEEDDDIGQSFEYTAGYFHGKIFNETVDFVKNNTNEIIGNTCKKYRDKFGKIVCRNWE